MEYQEAQRQHANRINRCSGKYEGIPIANNTRLVKRETEEFEDPVYAVKLHETDVVDIRPDGTYKLRTGGWKTRTTKGRINSFSPTQVYTDNGVWRVATQTGDELFADDMVVDSLGVVSSPDDRDLDDVLRAKRKLDRDVTAYVNGFMDYLAEEGTIPSTAGDCFICMAGFGPEEDNPTHLLGHIEKDYYVSTLLYNALKEEGEIDSLWLQMSLCDLEKGKKPWHLRHALTKFFRARKDMLVKARMSCTS